MIELYDETYAREECDRIFELVDVDQSGKIDFTEFMTASANKSDLLKEDKLKIAFKAFDIDGNGSITIDEIKRTIGVGQMINEDVWTQVVSECDTNGDGVISFDEFKMMME